MPEKPPVDEPDPVPERLSDDEPESMPEDDPDDIPPKWRFSFVLSIGAAATLRASPRIAL